MKRYRGTETVEPGLYFNLARLSFTSVEERAALPGRPQDTFRRVPLLALLVVGPVLGLVYVMFLPFLGFVMVAGLLSVKLGRLAGGVAAQAARIVRPGWAPSLAFFSRSKAAKEMPPEPDRWAEEAKKKIDGTDGGAA